MTIKNPECEIADFAGTISNYTDENYKNDYFNGTIYGYENSTAQAYAENYGYAFELIGNVPAQTTPAVTTAVTTTTTTENSDTTNTTNTTATTVTTATSTEATTVSTTVTTAITTALTGTARPTGDANGDDKMTVSDAAFIARMLAKRITISVDENPYADYNKDGKVTVADAAAIARYLAKAKNK